MIAPITHRPFAHLRQELKELSALASVAAPVDSAPASAAVSPAVADQPAGEAAFQERQRKKNELGQLRPAHARGKKRSAAHLAAIREGARRRQRLYDNVGYMPTPEQIKAATAEIRKGWTPREYRKRAGLSNAVLTALRESRLMGMVTDRHRKDQHLSRAS